MSEKTGDSYPIVYIEWIDAEHEGEWSSFEEEEKHDLGACFSCGYLIHENAQRYIIASSFSQAQVGNKQYIPKGMVTKVEVIRPKGGERGSGRRRRISRGVVHDNKPSVSDGQPGRTASDGAPSK